jgi:hypothetical protein
MSERFADAQRPVTNPPDDRLDSWKDLRRDVTTVQRWEKREGMPVHRHVHDKLGTVYAYRADLDAWSRSRNLRVASDPETSLVEDAIDAVGMPGRTSPEVIAVPVSVAAGTVPSTAASSRAMLWLLIAAAIVAAVGTTIWLLQQRNPRRQDLLAEARFEQLTDFDGIEQAATISRDGRFVAFLSDRDGPMDVWLTGAGPGLHILRSRDGAWRARHLAHQADRRPSRTDHPSQLARQPSGAVE